MKKLGIEFCECLCWPYVETSIILFSILNSKRIEINIREKVDYLLRGLKRIFVCSLSWPKMCLCIPGGSSKNINYLGLFSREIIVINDEFTFNLDFLIFKGWVLPIRERF
jgi:hypothetical protein